MWTRVANRCVLAAPRVTAVAITVQQQAICSSSSSSMARSATAVTGALHRHWRAFQSMATLVQLQQQAPALAAASMQRAAPTAKRCTGTGVGPHIHCKSSTGVRCVATTPANRGGLSAQRTPSGRNVPKELQHLDLSQHVCYRLWGFSARVTYTDLQRFLPVVRPMHVHGRCLL